VENRSGELRDRAARAIDSAQALLISAGAGMGVDSGLPDFRGNEGFWNAYPPLRHLGISFVDMANPSWFEKDPSLAWGFYGHRLNLYRETTPHHGFQILRNWAKEMTAGSFVFTSNVDGHFQRAGFEDTFILECHGSLNHLQCSRPCGEKIWPADATRVEVDSQTFRASDPLPVCPECGNLARPNVLMFGDYGWRAERSHAQESRFRNWLASVPEGRLVIIELGAGTAVPTVRFTSERAVDQYGGTLIRINTREPHIPRGEIGLAAGALEALEDIDQIRRGR
jgi:NAD-dependent SIR2 family protein deacetylase